MIGFTTRAIHCPPRRPDPHRALRMPVYDSVAFEHGTALEMQQAFAGRSPSHSYSRISNPTVEDFELRVRQFSGGAAAVAVASGMAAISGVVMVLAGAGTNIVTSRHLFGNTRSLFTQTLRGWGLEVRWADMTEPATVAAAIDQQTRAIFLESMTNPQLEVADLAALAAVADRHGIPLVVDSTLTTPYLLQAGEVGVHVEIISSTKAMSGGATSVGGVIIDHGGFDWRRAPRLADRAARLGPLAFTAAVRQEVCRNLGACLAPHHAYLQSLGLETMALRLERCGATTLALAAYLEAHPEVKGVHYPWLAGSPYHALAARLYQGRFGSILTFDLADREACFSVLDQLRLIRRASNIHDHKTLALHPATTLFAEYTEEERRSMGVRPTMLRLSVGLEERDDLVADLERGLATL